MIQELAQPRRNLLKPLGLDKVGSKRSEKGDFVLRKSIKIIHPIRKFSDFTIKPKRKCSKVFKAKKQVTWADPLVSSRETLNR